MMSKRKFFESLPVVPWDTVSPCQFVYYRSYYDAWLYKVVAYMMPVDPRPEMDRSASPFGYIRSWIIRMSFVRCTLSCMCILNFSVNTVYDRASPLHKGSCIEGMSFLASNLKRASAIVTVSGLELERLVSFNSTRSAIQESNAMAIFVWGLWTVFKKTNLNSTSCPDFCITYCDPGVSPWLAGVSLARPIA